MEEVKRNFEKNEYFYLGTKILVSKKEGNEGKKFGVVDLYKLTFFDDGSIFYNLENPFVSQEVAQSIIGKAIPRFAKVSLELEQIMDLRSKPRLLNLNVAE